MAGGKRIVISETSDGFLEALTGGDIKYTCKDCNSYSPYSRLCPTCASNMGFGGSEAKVEPSRVKFGGWTNPQPNSTNS